MSQKQVYHIIEWVVAIGACGFLVWKLATYEDYPALWETLCGTCWKQWSALLLCVALMPVNMAIEAWKWRTLWNYKLKSTNHEFLPFSEAQRQVYYSKLAGLITPWRLGEYPARGVQMEQSEVGTHPSVFPKVLAMGAVGSATMTAAIIMAGVAAVMTNYELRMTALRTNYVFVVSLVLLALVVALYFAPRLMKRWADVSHKLVAVSLGQSFVRLLCWCVQLGLVLYALGAICNLPFTICNLFVYYLLVTITPNVPVAEAGVRGAWAIFVFGSLNAALAGVLLWAVNTLLPCLVWPFLRKKEK